MLTDNLSCLILVGGRGTRMGSLTKNNPKPLLKVGKFTILSHIFTQVRLLGLNKVIFCTGYLSKKIEDYIHKNLILDSNKILKKLNKKKILTPKFYISRSSIDATTSERIINANKIIKRDSLLVIYGDTLLNINYKKFKNYLSKNALADILLKVSNPRERFGVVKILNNKVISFLEKNYDREKWVNSGWMFINNNTLLKINNKKYNFEEYIMKNLKKLNIKIYKNKFYYLPIDNISDLQKANFDWKRNKKIWF